MEECREYEWEIKENKRVQGKKVGEENKWKNGENKSEREKKKKSAGNKSERGKKMEKCREEK